MGKQSGKKKKQTGTQTSESSSPRNHDDDASLFFSIAQETKDEGNKLFQKRDYGGAMMKYEKAITLLPKDHVEVAHLRTNIAACYMQTGLNAFPNAIHECDLALEVAPKHSKALLKRARCYEGLKRLDLALKDISMVLKLDPNNLMAEEVWERVKATLENKGLRVNDNVIELPPEYVEPSSALPALVKVQPRERGKNGCNFEKKKTLAKTVERKHNDKVEEKLIDENTEEKNIEVVEKKIHVEVDTRPKMMVKLVLGEDIRWAEVLTHSSLLELREVIHERFPISSSIHVKYRDQEGDLITITSDEELKLAKELMKTCCSMRFYIVEVTPKQDPFYERLVNTGIIKKRSRGRSALNYIDEWIVEFAQLFKEHTGLDTKSCLNLHELGIKGYSEALEEAISSEQAQNLFEKSAESFKDMTALALFNWGNVCLSRARKRVDSNSENALGVSMLERIRNAYNWIMKEYNAAWAKYEEAVRIKPDMYEAVFALGQLQFEKARVSWYYGISCHAEHSTLSYLEDTLQMYDLAECNIENGMRIWEESVNCSSIKLVVSRLKENSLKVVSRNTSSVDAAQQLSVMTEQLNLLWGMVLYERSNIDYKLGLSAWREHFELATKKFELSGASSTDMSILAKSHFSNTSSQGGLTPSTDETVQAWNEFYVSQRCKHQVPSSLLDPILHWQNSELYHVLF